MAPGLRALAHYFVSGIARGELSNWGSALGFALKDQDQDLRVHGLGPRAGNEEAPGVRRHVAREHCEPRSPPAPVLCDAMSSASLAAYAFAAGCALLTSRIALCYAYGFAV
eukprot:2681734-Rhodomonas_salina.2